MERFFFIAVARMSDSTSDERTLSLEKGDRALGSNDPSSDVDIEREPPTSAPAADGPPTTPPPPPNGGLTAWLQVLGGFLFVLNTW